MINSYDHVFIYRYVFEIIKWKKLSYRQLFFFKYNIILHCVFILHGSVKSYFLKTSLVIYFLNCSVVYYFRT